MHQNRARGFDEGFIDVLFAQGHVGAVGTVENHRGDTFFLDGQQYERGQAVRVGDGVNVWQMDTGKIVARQQLLNAGLFGPFVQLSWEDQDLPRLTLSAHEPHPEAGLDLSATPTLPDRPVSPGPTRPPVHPSVLADVQIKDRPNMDALIWNHFQSVLDAHLGEAGLRLYAVIHAQHAVTVGAPLVEALGLHVERVAGRPAGQEFRRHVAPLTTLSKDSL